MNWIYSSRQKTRAALLLMGIVITIVAGTLWEKSLITTMNNSFSTLYKDRLIPAAALFHINDLLHTKRLILEKQKSGSAQVEVLQEELAQYNAQIDSIISDYEETYLVDEESKGLILFKAKMERYNALEKQLITRSPEEKNSSDHEATMAAVFKEIRKELSLLADIQTSVGKQLMHINNSDIGYARIIIYLQVVLIVIITMGVQAVLWKTKKIIPKDPQNFNLN